jgi:hypothetical protein
MENMSFDNLSLLLTVIEIRVVLHILVHVLQGPVVTPHVSNLQDYVTHMFKIP